MIHLDRAIHGMAPVGDPRTMRPVLDQPGLESTGTAGPAGEGASHGETSSFSIADRFGNLVSVTHSVNGTFGSGIVVEGGGFVLTIGCRAFIWMKAT